MVAIHNHQLEPKMNTSEFLSALRARPELPLAFSTQAGSVPASYHLTEVKRVSHDSVDCGSVAHTWTENHFELWAPHGAGRDDRPMPASKFLSIIEKVRSRMTLDDNAEARVFGRVAGGSDQLHQIESIETSDSSITVHLEPVGAQCKAREREDCCPPATDTKESTSFAGCGCGTHRAPPTDADVLGFSGKKNYWVDPFETQGFRFLF